MVTLELHCVECIEFTRTRRFLEDLVDRRLEVRVERLEKIFEEQGEQLSCAATERS